MNKNVFCHSSEGFKRNFKNTHFLFVVCVCVCVRVCLYMHVGALEGQKRAFDSLELELYADVSRRLWTLGSVSRFSVRTASALHC